MEQLHEFSDKPLVQSSQSTSDEADFPDQTHILLAGPLTITASSCRYVAPPITLRSPSGHTHTLFAGSPTHRTGAQITALALDQSPPTSSHLRLASFLSTGEFTIFDVDHSALSSSARKLTYIPTSRNSRTAPIIQAVYHHPLLITLSQTFHLSVYDLSSDSVTHTQTLTSYTSYPPSSLVLSTPSPTTYKLVLAYACPVYPAHWSVGATELIISGPSSSSPSASVLASPFSSPSQSASYNPLTVIATRTTRALDVPPGWIDEHKLRSMREQWGRKVSRVADTQTDGKWVILAPGALSTALPRDSPSPSSSSLSSQGAHTPISSSSSSIQSSFHSPTQLQLYRLHLPSPTASPKLVFVRSLYGQTGSISALALADGRCVSLGVNGSIWVWDLEGGTGAEVASATGLNDEYENEEKGTSEWFGKGTVVFDERRIISSGTSGIQVRRFDI